MASRKRYRGDGDRDSPGALEDDLDEENAPDKKRVLNARDADLLDDHGVSNGDFLMETDYLMRWDNWKCIWKHLSTFLRLDDLCALRRACHQLCRLVGPSFLAMSRFSVVPSGFNMVESLAKHARALELFRSAPLSFPSVPPSEWSFWCVQSRSSLDTIAQRHNLEVLHLNSEQLVPGALLRENFPRVHTLTLDSVVACACFEELQYDTIHTLAVLPPRPDLNVEEAALSLQNEEICEFVADFSSPQNAFVACMRHFLRLVANCFPSLQKISFCASSWPQVLLLIHSLRDRRLLFPHASPLTHFVLTSSVPLTVPEDMDILSGLVSLLPELEEVWIDPTILCTILPSTPTVDVDSEQSQQLPLDSPLPSNQLTCLHAAISAQDSPLLAFPKLNSLNLMIPNPEHCILFGSLPSLTDLELSAPFHVLSVLLEAVDSSSLPLLTTLKFHAYIMVQSPEAQVFKVGNIPTLKELTANFTANTPFQTISLHISGERLHSFNLTVPPNIWLERLDIDTNVSCLEKLHVVSGTQPRLSSVNRVLLSYLPPSLKSVNIPAQWRLCAESATSPEGILPLEVGSIASEALYLATFSQVDAMQLHTQLTTLCLQVLVELEDDFLELFAHVLPVMPNLANCLLRIVSPDVPPPHEEALPIHTLHSQSLNMLNIKLLPTVWAKPSSQSVLGGTPARGPNAASALDPNLAVVIPGHTPPASGRANCQVPSCICSGYSRDVVRRTAVSLHCATLGCGHTPNDHRPVADYSTQWLSIALDCPKLTHLALGGLSSVMDISTLLKRSPLLTHVQVSLSETPERLTIAHPNLSCLHLARLDCAHTIYMNLPKLVRLFVEACPVLSSLNPLPTPNLESVHVVGSSSITPECRIRLERTNPKAGTKLIMGYPKKTLFPDFFPTL